MFKNLNPEALGISGRDSEVIELVLSNAFKGLDVDLVGFVEQVKTQGFARASRLIVSARLKTGSFPLPVRWEHEPAQYQADLQALPALCEVAVQLGCTRATTSIEAGSDTRRYHENYEFHRARLTEVAEVLDKYKIRLGVGFLAPLACRAGLAFQFMQTFDELLLLLRSIGPANVGLAFDAWHFHLGGGKLESLLSLPGDKIVTVALSDIEPGVDAAGARLAARRWPAENGVIDNGAILSALADMRYDGPVTPLADPSQLASLGRDKIIKQAAAALDHVWRAAGLNPAGKRAAVPGR
jgi:sugar phosphate isomerase/epimerase